MQGKKGRMMGLRVKGGKVADLERQVCSCMRNTGHL